MAAFSGAWLTQSQVDPQVPLVPNLDPQHLNPDPNPQFQGMNPDWRNSAPSPDLPEAMWDVAPAPLATGVGPVDHIDYNNTLAGTGWGHGLSDVEARDLALTANLTDDGSYAARRYQAPRMPGGTYHADFIRDDDVPSDSPGTVMLQRSGVNTENDPWARRGHRLQRWFDGAIDMHRWEVTFRPLRPRYARPTPVQSNADPGQRDPHTQSVVGYNPGSLDTFVQGIVRRVPGNWAQPFTADGTTSTLVGAVSGYGLTTWGQ